MKNEPYVIIICLVVFVAGFWLLLKGYFWLKGIGAFGSSSRRDLNKDDYSPPTPKQKFDDAPITEGNTKMGDDNGIAELIHQQELTNRHLQQLIKDFNNERKAAHWFRCAVIFFFLFGSLGVVVLS